VKLDRKDFIGKMALLKLKSEQTKRRFVQLVLEDHDLYANWPWGGEPIFRNGKFCGYTTSTTYGFTLEKQVCLGFVHNFDEKTGEKLPVTIDYLTKNATYEVDIASKRYRAKIHVYPPNLNLNIRH
jgi:pyruvate dehydrogenase phosphatase regulatory subunit